MTATQHVHDGHKVDYDGQSMTATNYDGHINDGHKYVNVFDWPSKSTVWPSLTLYVAVIV